MEDDARSKRAAALEEKRRRLQQLKARRSNRTTSIAREIKPASANKTGSGPKNLDSYIDGLLAAPKPVVVIPEAPVAKEAEAEKVEVKEEEERKEEEVVEVKVVKKEMFTIATQTEDVEGEEEASIKEEEVVVEEEKEEEKEEAKEEVKEWSKEDICLAKESASFSSFLDTASKKVERFLGGPILADLLIDVKYGLQKESPSGEPQSGGLVYSRQTYECPRWTRSRRITDLSHSPFHKELILASYHSPPVRTNRLPSRSSNLSSTLEPGTGETYADGLVAIYSLSMPTHPEHVFTCSSPVLASKFHPSEPHLVLGGCHSGRLCLWDMRSGRLPVQRSNLGNPCHSHPIRSLRVVESGRGIVTAGLDGLKFWNLGNLSDPAESLSLEGNPSSMGVADGDTIVCGDEFGSLHVVVPNGRKRAVSVWKKAHFGMVTGVATREWKNKRDVGRKMQKGFSTGTSGLVLTSGVDWTTKLWALAYSDQPLLTFLNSSYDCMSHVAWSPSHPSIFATASTNGNLGLWNLATSLDEPMSGSDGLLVDTDSANGINKIQWSADGKRIAVATSDKLHVLGMVDDVSRGKEEDDKSMMQNLLARGLLQD